MTEPPTKQARANLAGDSHSRGNSQQPKDLNRDDIRQHVTHLNRDQLADIVIKAADEHSDVNVSMQTIIEQMRERERKRVIDFDSDSKHVWYEINIRYRKLSGSKQYDMAGDVYWTVLNTINDIVKKCGPLASAEIRFNGLSVLKAWAPAIMAGDI